MKQFMKRLMAEILVAVLLLSALPLDAFAETPDTYAAAPAEELKIEDEQTDEPAEDPETEDEQGDEPAEEPEEEDEQGEVPADEPEAEDEPADETEAEDEQGEEPADEPEAEDEQADEPAEEHEGEDEQGEEPAEEHEGEDEQGEEPADEPEAEDEQGEEPADEAEEEDEQGDEPTEQPETEDELGEDPAEEPAEEPEEEDEQGEEAAEEPEVEDEQGEEPADEPEVEDEQGEEPADEPEEEDEQGDEPAEEPEAEDEQGEEAAEEPEVEDEQGEEVVDGSEDDENAIFGALCDEEISVFSVNEEEAVELKPAQWITGDTTVKQGSVLLLEWIPGDNDEKIDWYQMMDIRGKNQYYYMSYAVEQEQKCHVKFTEPGVFSVEIRTEQRSVDRVTVYSLPIYITVTENEMEENKNEITLNIDTYTLPSAMPDENGKYHLALKISVSAEAEEVYYRIKIYEEDGAHEHFFQHGERMESVMEGYWIEWFSCGSPSKINKVEVFAYTDDGRTSETVVVWEAGNSESDPTPLAAPVMVGEVDREVVEGEVVTVEWNEVTNAAAYSVVIWDENKQEVEGSRSDDQVALSYTYTFDQPGTYVIGVYSRADAEHPEYCQSETAGCVNVTVTTKPCEHQESCDYYCESEEGKTYASKWTGEKPAPVYEDNTDSTHYIKLPYYRVCTACEKVLEIVYGDAQEAEHSYNAEGICACGYDRASCNHTPADGSAVYVKTLFEAEDAHTHKAIADVVRYTCSKCSLSYEKTEPRAEDSVEKGIPHAWNKNGVCMSNGCEYACEHNGEWTKGDKPINGSGKFSKISKTQHKRVSVDYTYTCANCGHAETRTDHEEGASENHLMKWYKTFRYDISEDNTKHRKIGQEVCRWWVEADGKWHYCYDENGSMHIVNAAGKWEDHSYDGAGQCTVCGYIRSGAFMDNSAVRNGDAMDNELALLMMKIAQETYGADFEYAKKNGELTLTSQGFTNVERFHQSLKQSPYLLNSDVADKANCDAVYAAKQDGEDITVCISFEGTYETVDWILDGLAWQNEKGIHVGFYAATEVFWQKMGTMTLNGIELDGKKNPSMKEVVNYAIAHPDENVKFMITGHSLGGAQAQILTWYLLEQGMSMDDILTYTFEAPIPFSSDSNAKKYAGAHVYNYINESDIVPKVGASSVGYDILSVNTMASAMKYFQRSREEAIEDKLTGAEDLGSDMIAALLLALYDGGKLNVGDLGNILRLTSNMPFGLGNPDLAAGITMRFMENGIPYEELEKIRAPFSQQTKDAIEGITNAIAEGKDLSSIAGDAWEGFLEFETDIAETERFLGEMVTILKDMVDSLLNMEGGYSGCACNIGQNIYFNTGHVDLAQDALLEQYERVEEGVRKMAVMNTVVPGSMSVAQIIEISKLMGIIKFYGGSVGSGIQNHYGDVCIANIEKIINGSVECEVVDTAGLWNTLGTNKK